MIFCKGYTFSKVEERERKGGKEKSLSELHYMFGGYTRRTTVKGATRRIECYPKIWCSVIRRRCMSRPKGTDASQMLRLVMHVPTTFLFNLCKCQIVSDPTQY
jgi:hypothetical protein